jgi:hypothetical protein
VETVIAFNDPALQCKQNGDAVGDVLSWKFQEARRLWLNGEYGKATTLMDGVEREARANKEVV